MHRTVRAYFMGVFLVLVGCPTAHDPDGGVYPDRRAIDGGPIPGCEPLAEMCNGLDEDCDGVVDEGGGRSVGCAPGERCSAGDCVCPTGSVCGGRCVDLESSFSHCGSCGNSCSAGEACIDGGCCLPERRPTGYRIGSLTLVARSRQRWDPERMTGALAKPVAPQAGRAW